MTKRQQSLLRWLERNADQFPTELDLRTTAEREMSVHGAEADWLAKQWRDKPVGPVVPETTPTAGVVQPAPQQTAAPADTYAGTGPGPQNQPNKEEPMTTTDLDHVDHLEVDSFTLDQRRAKAYAESGYWPDAASVAKALVKIEAGRSLGLPAIVAMSEVHVIEGKPTLGAGALSTLVKRSGRYDFRVIELTNELCRLRFYDQGESVGESVFTLDDAQKAGLLARKGSSWDRYPRNMLFARAMTNGVAWFAPDAIGGRFYTTEEMRQVEGEEEQPIDVEPDEVPV